MARARTFLSFRQHYQRCHPRPTLADELTRNEGDASEHWDRLHPGRELSLETTRSETYFDCRSVLSTKSDEEPSHEARQAEASEIQADAPIPSGRDETIAKHLLLILSQWRYSLQDPFALRCLDELAELAYIPSCHRDHSDQPFIARWHRLEQYSAALRQHGSPSDQVQQIEQILRNAIWKRLTASLGLESSRELHSMTSNLQSVVRPGALGSSSIAGGIMGLLAERATSDDPTTTDSRRRKDSVSSDSSGVSRLLSFLCNGGDDSSADSWKTAEPNSSVIDLEIKSERDSLSPRSSQDIGSVITESLHVMDGSRHSRYSMSDGDTAGGRSEHDENTANLSSDNVRAIQECSSTSASTYFVSKWDRNRASTDDGRGLPAIVFDARSGKSKSAAPLMTERPSPHSFFSIKTESSPTDVACSRDERTLESPVGETSTRHSTYPNVYSAEPALQPETRKRKRTAGCGLSDAVNSRGVLTAASKLICVEIPQWYNPQLGSTLYLIYNVPDCPAKEVDVTNNAKELTTLTYGRDAIVRQLTPFLSSIEFTDMRPQLETDALVPLRCSKYDILPELPLPLSSHFFFDTDDDTVTTAGVTKSFRAAFKQHPCSASEPSLYKQVVLPSLRKSLKRYLVVFLRTSRVYRFYMQIATTRGHIIKARFSALDTDQVCTFCDKRHATVEHCHSAQALAHVT